VEARRRDNCSHRNGCFLLTPNILDLSSHPSMLVFVRAPVLYRYSTPPTDSPVSMGHIVPGIL
jgi:hypothetical protein